MGISIHYSGRIADKKKLPQLIEEVEEIALAHGWKFNIYERVFNDLATNDMHVNCIEKKHDGKLYGIDFSPEGSEPVSVCFLSNGVISSFMQMVCWGTFEQKHEITTETITFDENGKEIISTEKTIMDENEYYKMLCYSSSKTQFAGPQTHELIIGVLRYIAKTYLADFVLHDESQFWETGDRELMFINFKRTGFLINSGSSALKNNIKEKDEDIENYILRIIKNIGKRNNEEESE